ncbi:hypothetical protein FOA52_007410 [Chlamydomonas sp. UWO 241]|nr:hypothetical protein FOA52_007410 [Chlamydomonas sp. UWO 241]
MKRSGSPQEQRWAAQVAPLVENSHFLLVTLLLCNAVAMEALPLFLDRLADPVTAIIVSVTMVLFFGEIVPQSLCTKYGLAIGASLSWLVRLLMVICCPIAWPVGRMLDWLLGSDHHSLFRRKQLKALVDMHGEDKGMGGKLSKDETRIITGALDLTSKTAQHAMTPLDKVFMLSTDDKLDERTLRAVIGSGHSRIPVHHTGNREDIVGIILVKELLQYKISQQVPVAMVKMRSLPRLPASTPMYDLLKLFQTGRSHMAVLTASPAEIAAMGWRMRRGKDARQHSNNHLDHPHRNSGASGPTTSGSGGGGTDTPPPTPFPPLPTLVEGVRFGHGYGSCDIGGAAAIDSGAAAINGGGGGAGGEASGGEGASGGDRGGDDGEFVPLPPLPGDGGEGRSGGEAADDANAPGRSSSGGDGGGGGIAAEIAALAVTAAETAAAAAAAEDAAAAAQLSLQPSQPPGEPSSPRNVPPDSAGGAAGVGGRETPPDSPSVLDQYRQFTGHLHGSPLGADRHGTSGGDRSIQHGTRLGAYNPDIFLEYDADGAGGDRDRDRDGSGRGSRGSEDNYDEYGYNGGSDGPSRSASMNGQGSGAEGGDGGGGGGGGGDGHKRPIGVITIEDVIEELIRSEIVDETDLFVDNEHNVAVNQAALAQGLPERLRRILSSDLTAVLTGRRKSMGGLPVGEGPPTIDEGEELNAPLLPR